MKTRLVMQLSVACLGGAGRHDGAGADGDNLGLQPRYYGSSGHIVNFNWTNQTTARSEFRRAS